MRVPSVLSSAFTAETPAGRRLSRLLATVVLLSPLMFGTAYLFFQFSVALTYATAVLGLVVITGFGGQINLGQSAFFAIGAYSTAILTKNGWPVLVTIPVGLVLAFGFGILSGLPASRLAGPYLALFTLALSVATAPVANYFSGSTGGVEGISVRAPEVPAWLPVNQAAYMYLLALAVFAIMLLATRNFLHRGGVSRALTAVGENSRVAVSLGVQPTTGLVVGSGFSAACAGAAGSVYAIVNGFVSSANFDLLLAGYLVAGLVIGGVNSLGGTVLAGLVLVFVPAWTGTIGQGLSGLVFGIAVILIMIVLRGRTAIEFLRTLRPRVAVHEGRAVARVPTQT